MCLISLYDFVCLCLCMCTMRAWYLVRSEEGIRLPGTGVPGPVSHSTWVLQTEPGRWRASALHCWAALCPLRSPSVRERVITLHFPVVLFHHCAFVFGVWTCETGSFVSLTGLGLSVCDSLKFLIVLSLPLMCRTTEGPPAHLAVCLSLHFCGSSEWTVFSPCTNPCDFSLCCLTVIGQLPLL